MAISLPNTIENDSPADAAEVQQNFTALQAHVNTNLIDRNGSVAMNQPLTLFGDPTQPNHAANKDYVDGKSGTVTPWTPTMTGLTVGGGTITGSYLKQGRACHLAYQFLFGAGSAITASVKFSLPFTAESWGSSGVGYMYDADPSKLWPVHIVLDTKDTAKLYALAYDSFYSLFGDLPTSGWATGDEITFSMTYITTT